MKTAARKVLALCAVAVWLALWPAVGRGAPAAAPLPPPPGSRDLLAHGTDQFYWAANVAPTPDPRTPGVQTSVRFRTPGDVEWREIAQFEAPATALSNRGSELLVVMLGGQWAIVSDSGSVRSGAAPPGGAEVMDLAGAGDDDVWAVAAAPDGKMLPASPSPASTTSITTAASTTTAAASTTAPTAPPLPPHDVGLFRLHLGRWSEQDLLPAGVR